MLTLALSLPILASLATIGTAQNATINDTCTTGLHMIVARGSLESPGVGDVGVVSGNVSLLIPGSTVAAVSYPATEIDYQSSESEGVGNMTELLDTYLQQCPSSKVALLGYSQGAQVAADTVCGTSETSFTATAALSSSYVNNIIAIVLFGDPSHVPGEAWDLGTSNRSGIFPRQNNAACDPYASKMKSWCNTGDIYCDSGANLTTHGTYFKLYTTDAVNFIVGQWNASQAGNSSSSTTTTAPAGTSSTASPSASASASTTSHSAATSRNGRGVAAQVIIGWLVVGWLVL